MRATDKRHTPRIKGDKAPTGGTPKGVAKKGVGALEPTKKLDATPGHGSETGPTMEPVAPDVTREQRALLDASRPAGGGVRPGKGVLGFQLGSKGTLGDVRGQVAELKATSTDPMTSSHMAEVNPTELTRLDLQAYRAIVVDKSADWKEKTPAFEAYFADVKAYIDERRAQDPRFDALKDTRENFGAFLRHVVIIHAFEERLAAKAAARSAQGG